MSQTADTMIIDANNTEGNELPFEEQNPLIPSENPSENVEEAKKEEKKENAAYKTYLKEIESETDVEAKLRITIAFMENSISQAGTPNFKNFWEGRKNCLALFKENIPQAVRSQYWAKYIELSEEANRLKTILDEQSAFAVEQIEIAIKALEEEVGQIPQIIERSANIDLSLSTTIKHKQKFYNDIQKEINVLNVHASRINALRKELIKTDMRIRQKNKFFQRLSSLGDKVFPRRKELIKEISHQFTVDVEEFIEKNFSGDVPRALFVCREEIKGLQSMAKILTLNTQSFTETRTHLSECWDKIKKVEKERKKERAVQREGFKKNHDAILALIQGFNQAFEAGSLTIAQANQKIEDIVSEMRKQELGKEELADLRNNLNHSRKLVLDKVKAEEQNRLNIEQEKERQKKEKLQSLKKEIETLFSRVETMTAEQIAGERDDLLNRIETGAFLRAEKQELERQMKPFKDIINDKREEQVLNLSANEKETLNQLKQILKERKERRQEVKNQLEIYRKAAGASGLDFEQAMNYHAQVNEEKDRLDKMNLGVKEIEDKIRELEQGLKE